MKSSTQFLVVLVAISNLIAACGSPAPNEPADAEPAAAIQRTGGCVETVCQHIDAEYRSVIQSLCEACETNCIESGGDYESCAGLCEDDCHPTPTQCTSDTCNQSAYGFTITGAADQELEGACNKAALRDQQCGEVNVDPRCEHFAQLERHENIAAYDCVAALPCGQDASACSLPAGTLGDDVCSVVAHNCSATGGSCGGDLTAILNGEENQLRDDVVAALRACSTETQCQPVVDCVNAWLDAVYPAP